MAISTPASAMAKAASCSPPRRSPSTTTPTSAALTGSSTVNTPACAAGTLGAFMALLDVSIVNASLPVIQGEIGATQSEGTWVGTSYLVAEIVVMPLTAWLERLLGRDAPRSQGARQFLADDGVAGFAQHGADQQQVAQPHQI